MGRHAKLMEKARQMLKDRGFRDKDIETDVSYPIGEGKYIIIDMVGERPNAKVAVEVGQSAGRKTRVELLKKHFDEVILLPYYIQDGNKFHCLNCDYTWFARVPKPKECPKCKVRLG